MSDPVSVGLLILRVALAVVFLAHGVKHALGRERTTRWFASLGFRAPGFQWFASTTTELAAGLLLVLGLGTSLAAAGVVGVMFVAFWTVHRSAGFFITAFMKEGTNVEGYEYVAFLAFASLAIAIAGPGAYSVDEHISFDTVTATALLDGWVGMVIVGLGVLGGIALLATFWRPSDVAE